MTVLALHLAGGTDVDQPAETADQRLLVAATARDSSAFSQLVKRHYPVVYRVVWRMMHGHADAQDVTQEAFLRLWDNPRQVRDARALRAWLIRVAANLVTDRFRKAQSIDLDAAGEIADPEELAPAAMERGRIAQRIDQAVAQLPDRQRLALTLVHFEQFSNIKAAEVMEISVDAVESLLARARRALREELQSDWRDMLAAVANG
jgi:RNA polymerase sigma-70 factor (ECF subfamily)